MPRPLDVSEVGYSRDVALLRRVQNRLLADSGFRGRDDALAMIEDAQVHIERRIKSLAKKRR